FVYFPFYLFCLLLLLVFYLFFFFFFFFLMIRRPPRSTLELTLFLHDALPISAGFSLSIETPAFVSVWLERDAARSEEHTSELQSRAQTSYAVFCLKTKNN